MKIAIPEADEPELSVAPLIDMVFLLLVYFMVTCSLVKSEGDLSIRLPGALAQAQSVDMLDEQIVEITANGDVFLNGKRFDHAASQDLPELYATLIRYKQSCENNKTKDMITIQAADDTEHQRLIDVMNACAGAGIKNVTFSAGASDD